MKHTQKPVRLLATLAVIMAVFAVMAISASAATYEVGSTAELLALVGDEGEDYTYYLLDENGEVTETIATVKGNSTTLAADDLIQITQDFKLTATETVTFPAVSLSFESKKDQDTTNGKNEYGDEMFVITRTQSGFPMFTFQASCNFRLLEFDGANIPDNTSLGGAIYAKDKYCHFRASTNFRNFNAKCGGAIYAGYIPFYGSDGYVRSHYTIENCHASENGGAIYATKWFSVNWDKRNTSSYATVTIKNNSAKNGGGVYVESNTTSSGFEIVEGIFEGNTATEKGGAIYFGSESTTQVGFTRATIRNNTAAYGGGIYSVGRLVIKDRPDVYGDRVTEIYGNTATVSGGGIYLGGSGSLIMEGGTIGGEGTFKIVDEDGNETEKSRANVAPRGAGIGSGQDRPSRRYHLL